MAFAISGVGILQFLLFRSEQYRLIDSRIESTATLLISSDLSSADLQDFEEAEDIIREIVGGERFNQFIIVYGRNGRELYRSPNAVGLPQLAFEPKWQTIETEESHLVRVLTIPLDHPLTARLSRGPTRTLQTGLLLDEDLLRMRTVSRYMIAYSLLVLALILLTTFWLSETLLRPLKELAAYLRHLGSRLNAAPMVSNPSPPMPIVRSGDDEFGLLVTETERLRELISQSLKNTQVWTAQMAHELKTPLTILQNSLERVKLEKDSTQKDVYVDEATAEIAHLNGLITSFLEWSAAENFPKEAEEVNALKLADKTRDLVEKMQRQFPGRIKFQGDSSLTVFAKRGFVQQAIANLLTNALRYSSEGSVVEVLLSEDRVEIIDEGPGIPQSVLERIGEPFNHSRSNVRGYGLGLAWVKTICSKYGWELHFERRARTRDGRELRVTVASIRFPKEELDY